MYDSSNSGERDTDGSSSVGGEKVYKGRAEPVLVSLSLICIYYLNLS